MGTWLKEKFGEDNMLLGVGKLTVYRLPTVTELSSTDNRLSVVGRRNKNTISTSVRFGRQ
jgi:hypothetical protein